MAEAAIQAPNTPANAISNPAQPAGIESPAAVPNSGTNTAGIKPQEHKPALTPSNDLFEVTVNGKTRKITREEAIRNYQLGASASERFEQGAALSKKAEAIINGAKSNPIKALLDAGLNRDQIRDAMEKWYTQEFIEPETLSREELRARRAEAALEEYKQKEAEAERLKQQAELDQMTVAERERMQQMIIDAMETHGLPKNKFSVQRIAFYVGQCLKKGYEPPMDLIIQKVNEERESYLGDMAAGVKDYDQLVKIYGENTIKMIREADLKQLRERRLGNKAQAPSFPKREVTNPDTRTRPGDVNAYLKNLRLKK